jgi:nitrogen regulatory protein PII-like uncharacterized protein
MAMIQSLMVLIMNNLERKLINVKYTIINKRLKKINVDFVFIL